MRRLTRTLLTACFMVAATVTRVIDGDTFEARLRTFIDEERIARVRVAGVDALELGQPKGDEARAFAELWLMRSPGQVWVRACGFDKYGRVLGVVTREGRVLAEDLKAAGYAKETRQ